MCAIVLALMLQLPDVCPNCRPAPVGRIDNLSKEPSARSVNFIVLAPDAALAQRVLEWAEKARSETSSRLSGRQPLPDWPRPVTITVHRDHPGFFATEFAGNGVVSITLWAGDLHLESTVRHEVCHAVLHLRYPGRIIPRWLDEGLAVCQELPVEQQRQLTPLLRAPRRFSTRQLLGLTEYPREIGLFYAQSYSLVDFLIQRHGEAELLRFLETSFQVGQENALRQVLGYATVEELDQQWGQSRIAGDE
jgi:hypothetical protein